MKTDFAVSMKLGRKVRMDIVSAGCRTGILPVVLGDRQDACPTEPDALLAGGGGADWETTLEEALLSLHALACAPLPPLQQRGEGSVVLAFSGQEGLGSARFTLDLWSLLEQAEKVLADGGTLTFPAQTAGAFDPAAALARTLSLSRQLVLLSPGLAEHEEGQELTARLAELPAIAQKVRLCAREEEMWALLAGAHSASYSLAVSPLGWRGF
jgi:hypothetical protein